MKSKFLTYLKKGLLAKWEPKHPWAKKLVNALLVVFMLGITYFLGFNVGYFSGSGTYAFGPKQEALVPGDMKPVDAADLDAFVKGDQTKLEKYKEGFNCVEFALEAAHEAMWQGVPATVVRLDFENTDSKHWILGFVTTDEGWKFYEPQSGTFITPHVGGMFCDSRIVGIYYLYDLVWKPIEEELK
jgi:hypothetical protein